MTNPAATLKEFWDTRYRNDGFRFGTNPNDYLVQQIKPLPHQGKALCLADGEGRNGVWLAKLGYEVTSVDISSEGIEKAKKLANDNQVQMHFDVADIKFYPFDLQSFDLIVSIFFHTPAALRREIHQKVIKALKPGGCFIMEAYSPEQIGQNTGGPKELDLLVELTDVVNDFPGMTITHQYTGPRRVVEGDAHKGDAFVTQLTISKPL